MKVLDGNFVADSLKIWRALGKQGKNGFLSHLHPVSAPLLQEAVDELNFMQISKDSILLNGESPHIR